MPVNPKQGDAAGRAVARIVTFCSRHAVLVLALWMLLSAAAAWFVASRFTMDTDTGELLSRELDWRQRQIAFDKAFPQRSDLIVAVVDGRTPELAGHAAAALASRLARETSLFKAAWRPDGGDFFETNGLLYLSTTELSQTLEQLIAAQPLLGPLAADPSLRGLAGALALFARGAGEGGAPVDDLAAPFKALADALQAAHDNRVEPLAWRALFTGKAGDPRELRRFVLMHPRLDHTQLQPGAAAIAAVRNAAVELGLTPERGVRVRLTGQVPLAHEELATLRESAGLSAAVTISLVIVLLWIALRSSKLIAAVLASLFCGLAVTAAVGIALVGAVNLISIAFAVLFVGLGVDFGIQLAVAYRAERFEHGDLHVALRNAGARVGGPLALAAAATALGFFAFLPTAYRGVAELGLIAGNGMVIAFAASITLLPALLALTRPRGEAAPVGVPALARLDAFIEAKHRAVLAVCAALAAVSLALLPFLRFDFNPLNLRSERTESVATLRDLAQDPHSTPNTIDVLAPDLAAADAVAKKLAALPEVSQTLTFSSFVPEEQDRKLALIEDAAMLLGPALVAPSVPAPSDAQNAQAMGEAAHALQAFADRANGAAASEAKRLAGALSAVSAGNGAQRERAHAALIPGLTAMLAQMRAALQPARVTRESLPPQIRRDWIAADGRARVEVYPAGDSTDNAVLDRFVDAVRSVEPAAAGGPVWIKESGRAIVTAFVQAGALALAAITLVLVVVLRRAVDVALTLAPLVLSGLVTLALCAALARPLNYANIIALPLLFGIGVAFNIYFVAAWRSGARGLLASSLARAVIFSALTTASAFGSLWLSSHPGTASMGELLAMSLACTLACALVFLPALLYSMRRR
ncbi:MAG TPA: MMPL family transporter [Burkholderiales bacterium]|nr:MMPL family transporter [Burkholderiales bacterium]